ncbi:MAG TPA: two-component regulator propeller domain-containing protein, partial [Rubrobacteraceae bacterium]|nr:two-component regulator propeller domain-containing protein [Rubrobacteraceae bacterium]
AFSGGSVTRALVTRGRATAPDGGPPALPSAPGDASEFSTADGLAHDTVQTLLEMPDGVVWIGTVGGLTRFDGISFRSYTTAHGLMNDRVSVLAGDRDGNVWLGSPGGVMRLRPNGLVTYGEADGLGHTDIHALFEDETGEVIAVSGPWFVNRFDGRRFEHARFPIPADVTLPWSSQAALLDHTGAWWVLTNEGLFRFARSPGPLDAARRRPEAVLDSRHGLPGDSVVKLFEDSRGDVWVSARPPGRIGLVRWERATGALHTYSEADGFGGDMTVQSFAEDGAGRLWLGVQEGGLLRYEAGRFTLFTAGADGLPGGMVMSLHVDRKGRLWVATAEGGLGRVDDPSAVQPQFRVYTVADGIASNNIRCLVEDLAGRIYLGTVRGVDKLDPETGHVRHYTAADGLANDFVKSAARDRRGVLWFGTMNGLSSFAPEAEPPPQPPPAALIAGLRVAGAEQPVPELGTAEAPKLELTADQNNIQIDFFGIGLSAGEVLRYQYMIEGAGGGWGQPTAQRSVDLHLAPGSYRFLVRAVNADGAVSPAPAVAAFTIHPPFWQQWWFQTLAAVLFLTVLVVFERYRAARVKELNVSLDESQRLKEKLRARVVELGKVNRTLALEYHLTRVLGESETLGEAAPHILHAIGESAEWEIGTLWEVDEEAGVLRCVETSHLPEGEAPEFEVLSRESVFAPGVGLPGRVWQSREPHWVTDLADDENFPRIASAVGEGLRSAYAFPVLLGGRVTGVLEFFSRELRQPDEEMIKWISAVGSHIGQLIERMRTEEALG